MTLSSRDPHLGQRIVWKSQLPYHSLWCQRFFDGLYEFSGLGGKNDVRTGAHCQSLPVGGRAFAKIRAIYDELRTKCFWSAMRPRIAFIEPAQGLPALTHNAGPTIHACKCKTACSA